MACSAGASSRARDRSWCRAAAAVRRPASRSTPAAGSGSAAPAPAERALVEEITDPRLRVPATIADFTGSIYAVNARFDLPAPAPTDTHTIVKLPA
ncbi:hypothetical protein [Dactylosporangium sp. NPDC051541]|uniref:hypothetical protein n=1 Tax=Dactylosporangium sp. NPDC051541 TaxID=3363977 RepID=UPI0037B5B6A9